MTVVNYFDWKAFFLTFFHRWQHWYHFSEEFQIQIWAKLLENSSQFQFIWTAHDFRSAVLAKRQPVSPKLFGQRGQLPPWLLRSRISRNKGPFGIPSLTLWSRGVERSNKAPLARLMILQNYTKGADVNIRYWKGRERAGQPPSSYM